MVQHSRLQTNDKQTPVRSKADVTAVDSEAAFVHAYRRRNNDNVGPEEGGIRRPKAHRSVGAVSCAAVDDQDDPSDDYPEGLGAGHGFVR